MNIIGRFIDGLVGKEEVMMTTYPLFISWSFVLVAIAVLIILVFYFGYRRGERGPRFFAYSLGKIALSIITWEILWLILILLTSTGGSASEIFFIITVDNIVAYLMILTVLLFVENKLTSSFKHHEESS